MSKTLVIVESPGKIKKIQAYLGSKTASNFFPNTSVTKV